VSKLEKSFVISVPPARAWEVFTDGEERSKWDADVWEIDLRAGGATHWKIGPLESTGRVDEVVPEQLFRQTDLTGPHANSEITVTFEEVDEGTRVTITHAGFGDGEEWQGALESTSFGWGQAIADLFAYLETGVRPERFNTNLLSNPGMVVIDTPAGLRVKRTEPAGFAEQVGLKEGDLVLTVAGAPVFTTPEMWVILRLYKPGDKVAVDYISDGKRRSGSGELAVLMG